MKVRKLAVALALAGGLGSGVAQALGLGEIELQSYLNEPLEADISLNSSAGVSPSEVFVNLAPAEAYRQVGIDRSYFLTKLQFNVTTAPDGNLMVSVSTSEPVKEPYLNFLLEVTWPSGRLMREYSILVDPPVYAEDSGLTEQVQAPQTAQVSEPTPRPTPAPQATPVVSEAPAAPTSAPAPTTSRPAADTFGPTGAADTLWGIATAVRPNNSVSHQQVMLALQDLNPDAFLDGNINRLKRGQVLRIPSLDQIQSRSRAEANLEVAAQNEALSAPAERTVDARSVESAPSAAQPAAATGGDELTLLVADQETERTAEEGGSAGGDGQLAGGVDAGTAVAMEELESTRRENEELSGRVEDLQSQVETLQRLLELKNSQLAEFEQGLSDQDEAGVAAPLPEDQVPGEATGDVVSTETAEGQVEGEGPDASQPDALEGMAAEAEAQAEGMAPDEAMESMEQVPEVAGTQPSEGEPSGSQPQAEVAAPVESRDIVAPDAPAAPKAEEKGFPGNVIDMIMGNRLYQIGLGGGLILLLLLLRLVARRNASKEEQFYAQLESDADNEQAEAEPVVAGAGVAESGEEAPDPLAEADTYIAYGRLDQAAQSLEAAISREPSRSDLRVKLLGVYADAQNRASFDKQFGELEALEDESAVAEANALRARLDEAEEMPSIDDLESELMSDSFRSEAVEEAPLTEISADEAPEEPAGEVEDAFADFDLDLENEEPVPAPEEEAAGEAIEFDLSDLELEDTEQAPSETLTEDLSLESEGDAVPEADDLGVDFELDENTAEPAEELDMDLGDLGETLDLDEPTSDEAKDEAAALEDEFASLDLGDELSESEEQALEQADELSSGEDEGAGALDESFLDELDAELDKVAGSEAEDLGDKLADEGLEGLELDVTDEDLALIEKAADLGQDEPESEGLAAEADFEIEDLSMDELSEPEAEAEAADEAASTEEVPELEEAVPTAEEPVVELPVADQETSAAKTGYTDIDESDLGEEDDFDFLAGTDEAATKLDLARAYIEMGDSDGARDILEEVSIEGDDQQKAEAQDLLKTLS